MSGSIDLANLFVTWFADANTRDLHNLQFPLKNVDSSRSHFHGDINFIISNHCYNSHMDIRRYYFPGQIVFITQIVKDRKHIFNNPDMVALLKETLKNVKTLHPFDLLAYVFLPDHFHILIRPTGKSNFSQIMHSVKFNFTRAYKQKTNHIGSLSIWQKRFWDHVIRDETDLENHIHYIHYNPVKHGYVHDLNSWDISSYSTWQERGLYDNSQEWVEPEKYSWGE